MLHPSSLKKALLTASFAAFSVLIAGRAEAQTTGGPSVALNAGATVLHYLPDGVTAASHPNGGAQPSWISHDDCEKNILVRVPLTVTGTNDGTVMQVWAGANGIDCTDNTNRTGTTQQCWEVYPNGIPFQQSVTVDIKAQDIIAPLTLGTGEKPPTYKAGTTAACDTVTQSGAIPLTLYFMFLNSAGSVSGTSATYSLSAALIGPVAPTGVTVTVGSTLLKVSWTPANDVNTQGFQIFCDPPPGKEPAQSDSGANGDTITDSGTVLVCADGGTEDGGFDPDSGAYLGDIPVDGGCSYENQSTGTSGSAGCYSSEIVPGGGTTTTTTTGDDESGTGTDTVATGITPPPANIGDYLCGKDGSNVGSPTSSQTTLTGLKNGTHYVVGVAAYDVVGNIGPMSEIGCDSPTPVTDFWDTYKAAGGGAGGGFCSVDKNGEPAGLSAFALVGVASAISIVRRRRQNKKKGSLRT
ncbi:MAG TPA: hypothetical protein VF407_20030, partial [Polyangiaceae bacterium]